MLEHALACARPLVKISALFCDNPHTTQIQLRRLQGAGRQSLLVNTKLCPATLATVSTQRLLSFCCPGPLQRDPGHEAHKPRQPTGVKAAHHSKLCLPSFQTKLKADLFRGLYLWPLITFIRHSSMFCDTCWNNKSNWLCLPDGRAGLCVSERGDWVLHVCGSESLNP